MGGPPPSPRPLCIGVRGSCKKAHKSFNDFYQNHIKSWLRSIFSCSEKLNFCEKNEHCWSQGMKNSMAIRMTDKTLHGDARKSISGHGGHGGLCVCEALPMHVIWSVIDAHSMLVCRVSDAHDSVKRYRCMWYEALSTDSLCLSVALPIHMVEALPKHKIPSFSVLIA